MAEKAFGKIRPDLRQARAGRVSPPRKFLSHCGRGLQIPILGDATWRSLPQDKVADRNVAPTLWEGSPDPDLKSRDQEVAPTNRWATGVSPPRGFSRD